MKRHSAVLFPETVPDHQILFPLLLVFQPLVYCQPVENDQQEEICSPLCAEFFRQALYQPVFPAPLGPDKERFMRLLSDLRHRGDDYAAQLSHVSLASLGSVSRKEPETKGTILANLLKSHGIQQVKSDRIAMILWQARLILKLGEFFDDDQRMLRKEMEKISVREKGLIFDLRKESEHSFSLTEQLFSVSSEDDGLQRLRLKAWARIFALGSAGPEKPSVFITRNNDALERLAEEYERMKGSSPEKIISLLLPANANGASPAVEQLKKFSGDVEDFLDQFYTQLSGSSRESNLQEKKGAWEDLLEQYFPAGNCGRKELNLYRFDQVSAPGLFLDSFSQDDDIQLAESVENTESDIVIGVLSQA
ncbi:MAG: hypothetical protein OEM01_01715 [Desulfobulbaceae bacterium]|nr:hypothetical protein [Desulfobulbaceae bacterium]